MSLRRRLLCAQVGKIRRRKVREHMEEAVAADKDHYTKDQLLDILASIEWHHQSNNHASECPYCCSYKPKHTDDCKLNKALRAAGFAVVE